MGIYGWNLGVEYKESDPARAVELMPVLVAYQREIGHPDADRRAEYLSRTRARLSASSAPGTPGS